MKELHGDGAVAHRRGYSLDRAASDVADCEDSRHAGLEEKGAAIEPMRAPLSKRVRMNTTTGLRPTVAGPRLAVLT